MNAAESLTSERFRLAITHWLGLSFDESKRERLGELLRSRVDHMSLPVDKYLGMLESAQPPAGEIRELARQLTVGETYFFRNVEQFHALREHVLPDRVRRSPERPVLRVLSAGCATGEEPYSIAILIAETRDQIPKPVEIVGIDINEAAIAKAREGHYSQWSLRGTNETRNAHWFSAEGRGLKLDRRIRDMVTFEERNLLEDDPIALAEQRYDVIFCRNLLMYLTPEASAQVVDRLTRALVPGGYLFLGHAETLRGLTRDFHLHHTNDTFYYQRKRAGDVVAEPSRSTNVAGPVLVAEMESADSWVEAIGRASDRIRKLVERTTDATRLSASAQDLSVVIDLLRRERYVEALAVIDAVPIETSLNSDVLTLRAVLLAHRGNLAEAEATCRELLSRDELNAGAHYLMALCREEAGDRASAFDHDQMSVHLDAGFAAPRLHLGLMEKRAGRRFEARNHLALALVLLEREDPSRLLFFGGGFSRDALVAFCRVELAACGGTS